MVTSESSAAEASEDLSQNEQSRSSSQSDQATSSSGIEAESQHKGAHQKVASKRPQRASALAATKRVTHAAALHKLSQGNSKGRKAANQGAGAAHMKGSLTQAEASATSEATANHQLSGEPNSPTTSTDAEHRPQSRSAAIEQSAASAQQLPCNDKQQTVAPMQESDAKPDPDCDAAGKALTPPAAISAAEAAKTRRGRQRKTIQAAAPSPAPPAPEEKLVEDKGPLRRRASTKAAAKLRDQALADHEFSDSDYLANDSKAKQKRQTKGGSTAQGNAMAAAVTMESSPELPEKMDVLLGCTKCRYLKGGCGACRDKPSLERPASLRWKPDAGKKQQDIPVAPTFHPTAEEFTDPLAYIEKIKPEGERAGIACIVPPKGWAPPFALEKGTNGLSAESFRFLIRRQLTSHLCMRLPNTSRRRKAAAAARYGAGKVSAGANVDGAPLPEDAEEGGKEEEVGEFGFNTLDRTHTLKSFAASADWIKSLHFSDPPPTASKGASTERSAKRRKLGNYTGPEPTVDQIEAEFWRIIEMPDDVLESYYGQDLDSGHHGSGFPLPPFRQRLLDLHLQKIAADKLSSRSSKGDSDATEDGKQRTYTQEETVYSEHAWNINNLPRCKGSVLRYYIGDELITGVMVPWLYVGSCMSAFCWHVEDHALCSINYLHMGAPKVWYGVPAHASAALEEAMQDALPDLFQASPDLMYQLVTMVSPTNLQARGVPVHRLVHQEGSFVITFPNAYHSGFNTGFNCAEAVNFGPPDWLPYGTDIAEKYRRDGKAITLSHDALLTALVSTAPAVKQAADDKVKPLLVDLAVASDSTVRLSLSPKQQPTSNEEQPAKGLKEAKDQTKPPAASGKAGTKKAGLYAPGAGKRSDLTFLDPMNKADCPPKAIALAAGELVLRIREERRRRQIGGVEGAEPLPAVRMHGGTPGAVDDKGMYTDTEDVDCAVCKCDMWLCAVVSPACPGQAVCTEHATQLDCPRQEQLLLFRHTLEELERMVETARQCVPGVDAAVAAAINRKDNPPTPIEVNHLGPVNLALHSQAATPAGPLEGPDASLPAKRTRGKDKQPRGPRKPSKQDALESPGREGREAATAAAAVTGSNKGSKAGKAAGKEKRKRKVVKVERPVLKRSSRKRKAPASADASPVQAAPVVTHDRSIRKRARAAEQKAEQQQPEAQAKKLRTPKKASQAQLDHAVAQPVPDHLPGQHPQAPALPSPLGQPQAGSVAVPVSSAASLLGRAAGDATGTPSQLQPGSALAQGQTGQQSSLLQLAQQQMQQHLSQQPLQPSAQPQSSTGLPNQAAAGPHSELLSSLGSATVQQAYLAQLIQHQAAQANVHPFLVAAPYLAQLQQAQKSPAEATGAAAGKNDSSQQQLQQAVASQVPLLYGSQAVNQASLLPAQDLGPASVQAGAAQASQHAVAQPVPGHFAAQCIQPAEPGSPENSNEALQPGQASLQSPSTEALVLPVQQPDPEPSAAGAKPGQLQGPGPSQQAQVQALEYQEVTQHATTLQPGLNDAAAPQAAAPGESAAAVPFASHSGVDDGQATVHAFGTPTLAQVTREADMQERVPSMVSDGNLQGMDSFNPDDLFNDEG